MSEVQRYILKNSLEGPQTGAHAVGNGLVKVGAGAGAVWLTAGLLPFVSFPFLILAMVLIGGYLRYGRD